MKKLRGKKRKLKMIERRLMEAAATFPQIFTNDMYVWKLPASQAFVEGLKRKESAVITRFLESCAASLIEQKSNEAFKVAMLIFPQNMWYSQIIVFNNNSIQDDFIYSHVATGHWQPVMNDNIHSDWVVKAFTDGTQNLFCYIER